MELFNDKLRTGHYLQPSQLQDDLRIVSKSITAIENQVADVQEGLLAVPTEEALRALEDKLGKSLKSVYSDLEAISVRLEKIENKKPWWAKFLFSK